MEFVIVFKNKSIDILVLHKLCLRKLMNVTSLLICSVSHHNVNRYPRMQTDELMKFQQVSNCFS